MPKYEDFHKTKEEERQRIKQSILERGNATERQADEWAESRVENAMRGVVQHREGEGTSRTIEIRSK
jgi:hypothetical protein